MRSFLQAVNTGEKITVKMEAGVEEQIEAARRDTFCEVRQNTFGLVAFPVDQPEHF